VPTRLFFWIFL